MPWFKKAKRPKAVRSRSAVVPEGLWEKCTACREVLFRKELDEHCRVCPKCGHHFRLEAPDRIRLLLDGADDGEGATAPLPGAELFAGVRPVDALGFVDTKSYAERLATYQRRLDLDDAIHVRAGTIESTPVILAVMDYRFMGGSMGSVVGEKITLAAEEALDRRVPLVVVSASGGARMQEGALSLMQMGKISAALARLRAARLPYVSILTDPTTGGVTASFAMLGDLNLAEPGALIGFAGPRVIEQTLRESLPEGFQRSEFLLEKGFLDAVVERPELKATVSCALRHLYGRAAA